MLSVLCPSHPLSSPTRAKYDQSHQSPPPKSSRSSRGGDSNGRVSSMDDISKLYELSNEPKRKEFLDDLFSFMQKRGESQIRSRDMQSASGVLALRFPYPSVAGNPDKTKAPSAVSLEEKTEGEKVLGPWTLASLCLRWANGERICAEMETRIEGRSWEKTARGLPW
ncbi:hypothetical protein HPB50_016507 [Hyalomma asiaticum]|uniref:Uncharacterized protein n=1 Tax=Hyalomma asiaticum TaxID=266040 RepID=A0ACB7SZJ6_HYAAI|nr:hypothetical protein HPB50_016507 [Hyalomma asiaticum]